MKVFFAGTHRERPPHDTLAAITPLLGEFGITRLADVTGLDVLGIPVVMSVRPLARTLSVSQGKGATLDLARISAAMEAIELHHAERAVPAARFTDVPADQLSLPYPLLALEQHAGSLLTERTPLDWITARRIGDGHQVLVPRQAVQMGRDLRDGWRSYTLTASSNGLASGNTRAEAVVHALYEVIERDATSALGTVPAHERHYVDPTTVDEPYCAELIERIRSGGAWLEIVHAPSRFGVPAFACYLWHEDAAAAMVVGSGAHADAAVALSRAITEAAQSRLTFIAGTRDDIVASTYLPPDGFARPHTPAAARPWNPAAYGSTAHYATCAEEADALAAAVTARTGHEPMAVDLADRTEFAVVKVLCPGLTYAARHEIPRHEEATAA
ncbi:YcaO-like family protein [Streptomyces ossamyceticus]|nr:YcaO-like family protein [Streptomyces ossamyceticus]